MKRTTGAVELGAVELGRSRQRAVELGRSRQRVRDPSAEGACDLGFVRARGGL